MHAVTWDVLRFGAQPVQASCQGPFADRIHEGCCNAAVAVSVFNPQLPDAHHVVAVLLRADLSHQLVADKGKKNHGIFAPDVGQVGMGVLHLLVGMLDRVDVEVEPVSAGGNLDTGIDDVVAAKAVNVLGKLGRGPHDPYVQLCHVVHAHMIRKPRQEGGSQHSQPVNCWNALVERGMVVYAAVGDDA